MSDNVQRTTRGQRGERSGYSNFMPPYKLSCKTGASALLIVGTVLALGIGGRMNDVETPATHQPLKSSQQCAKEYEELFDLAQLARRDGKSSGVMVRELAVMSGHLGECRLPAYRKNLAFYADHTT